MQRENQPEPDRLARLIARQAEKRHLAAVWAARAGLGPGMTVLDIGAGTGALVLDYAAATGPAGRVIALDPDAESLGHASAEAARRGLKLDILQGTADALPTLPHAPDLVMLTDALHHMADQPAALRAIRRAMPPDARLFIAEYDPAGPGACGAPHRRRIARESVAALLRETGFACLAIADAPDEHYTILAAPAAAPLVAS